jgi:hypothetical protein
MIRMILLEQIYRAFKINNNETYHKWEMIGLFLTNYFSSFIKNNRNYFI